MRLHNKALFILLLSLVVVQMRLAFAGNALGTGAIFSEGNPITTAERRGLTPPNCPDDLNYLLSPGNFNRLDTSAGGRLKATNINIYSSAYTNSGTSLAVGTAVGVPGVFGYYDFSGYAWKTPQFEEILAFRSAANFFDYLQQQLGVTTLPTVNIDANGGGTGTPETILFGNIIALPDQAPSVCGGYVRYAEDGDIIPHEIGGHILTARAYDPLAEPLGDYWAAVMANKYTVGDWTAKTLPGFESRNFFQTSLSYPYRLFPNPEIIGSHGHHKNGQILNRSLWLLRFRLEQKFGVTDGRKLADYLAYQLSTAVPKLNTINTYHVFESARDYLVQTLATLQTAPASGTFKDLYKRMDKYEISEAFNIADIGRYPRDPFFTTQTTLLNRGGSAANQFHPTRDNYGSLIGYQTTSAGVDVKAIPAWAIQTGRRDIVVGVLDNGVNVVHEDLYENMWLNQGELPQFIRDFNDVDKDGVITFYDLNHNPAIALTDSNGNGYIDGNDVVVQLANNQDDDANGKVDDLIGWSFPQNAATATALRDEGGFYGFHGTPSAGVIGAMAMNGKGGVGVNWHTQLMPVKVTSFSFNKVKDIASSIQYTLTKNAAVINAPWALEPWGQSSVDLYDAVREAETKGVPYVAAIGNTSPLDNDAFAYYPQSYALKNVITVTALDQLGNQTQRFGKYTADLAAATGAYSPSLESNNTYALLGQTSGAAPHVTGAIALLLAEQQSRIKSNPSYRRLTLGEIRYLLLTSVNPQNSLKGKCVSEGSLNAYSLLLSYRDTDMDGYVDAIEKLFGTDSNRGDSFPNLNADADGDGLTNVNELAYGTIPIVFAANQDMRGKIYPIYLDNFGMVKSGNTEGGYPIRATDTDGDGVGDTVEVYYESDPANPFRKPLQTDNFDDGNFSDWTTPTGISGSWQVINGQLAVNTIAPSGKTPEIFLAPATSIAFQSGSLFADITDKEYWSGFYNRNKAFLVFGYQNNNNYFYAGLDQEFIGVPQHPTRWVVAQVNNGITTVLKFVDELSYSAFPLVKLKIVTSATEQRITLYANETRKLDITGIVPPAGRVGLATHMNTFVSFDNFAAVRQ